MRRHLTRLGSWKLGAAAALTASLFVPLMILGGPAFARSGAAASEYEYSSASEYQYKVTICHKTHSEKHPWEQITISDHALPAHERHGDTLPPCPPGTLSGEQHGQSGEHHGQSGEHHGSSAGGTTGSDNQSTSGTQANSSGNDNSAGTGSTSGSTSGSEHGNGGSHEGDNGGDHGSTGGQGGEHGGHGKP